MQRKNIEKRDSQRGEDSLFLGNKTAEGTVSNTKDEETKV